MVGKKFGESAADAVKELIMRMAPEQASVGVQQEEPANDDVYRLVQLAGI
jgi:hypothetical protein